MKYRTILGFIEFYFKVIAPGLGPGGRKFESCHPDKQNPSAKLMDFVFKEFKTLTLV